jgi:hydrogenase nickel incorporation protein HypA/HybF
MHEASMVRDMISEIESHALKEGASSVSRVVLELGAVSGLKPDVLRRMFETFSEGTIVRDARLVIEEREPVVRCLDCRKEMSLSRADMSCPGCGSADVEVDHTHGVRTVYLLRCLSCGELSEGLVHFCPDCRSRRVELVAGTGIILKEIEMEK